MGTVIPTAKNAGVNIESLGTSLAISTSKGIATSESVSKLNAMLGEVTKTGSITDKTLKELSGKGFTELQESGKSTGDILAMLEDHAKKSGLGLKDLFGSAEAGVMAMTLANDGGKEFNDTLAKMGDSLGATDKAFETMDSSSTQTLKKSLNEIKVSMLGLGEALAPTISQIAQGISVFADTIGKMNPEILATTVKLAGLTMGAGFLTKGVGGAVSVVGKLTGAVGRMATGFGNAQVASQLATGSISTLATSTATVGASTSGVVTSTSLLTKSLGLLGKVCTPTGLAITAVGVAGVGIGKALSKDVVPQVDLFATKMEAMGDSTVRQMVIISDATKEAVQPFTDLNEGVTKELTSLNMTSGIVTTEISNSLTGKFKEMTTMINTELNADLQKSLELFKTNGTNMTQEQIAINTKLQSDLKVYYEGKKVEVANGESRINEILTLASQQNRQLTLDEETEINTIKQRMFDTGLTALSTSEKDTIAIKERIKSQSGRIDAEMASEHMKTIIDSYSDSVTQASINYEEQMLIANQLKADGTQASKDLADNIITEATRQKEKAIEEAKLQKEGAIDTLTEAYPKLESTISTVTGNIMSFWDRLSSKWSGLKFDDKHVNIETNFAVDRGNPNKYAIGTNYAKESGIARVNELGQEMVIGKDGATRMLQGNYAYINKGDKVLTATQTKAHMQRQEQQSIADTITRALGQSQTSFNNSSDKIVSSITNALRTSQRANSNSNVDVEGIVGSLVGAITTAIEDITLQVQLDGKSVASATAPYNTQSSHNYNTLRLR